MAVRITETGDAIRARLGGVGLTAPLDETTFSGGMQSTTVFNGL